MPDTTCDEQGPPCAACVARDTTENCNYGDVQRKSPIQQEPTPCSSANGLDLSSTSGTSENEESETRRLLELRLLHRWMTHTWKCLHSMDEDVELLLEHLPQACLKYDYLLHATHSLCATDLAIHGDGKGLKAHDTKYYLATAMGYYDSASQSLRPQLTEVHPDSQIWLYMASIMLTMIVMAFPQCMPLQLDEPQPTTIERMGLIIELFTGNGKVAWADWFSLNAGPGGGMVQSAIKVVAGPPPSAIDPAIQSVLNSMNTVLHDATLIDSELNAPHFHTAYTRVSKLLELSLIEEARGQIQGLVVSVPMYCGREFFTAMTEAQPTALFLLIIFGALVERGARSGFWWANKIGPSLVSEATEVLERTQPHLMNAPRWREVIAWASAEVAVPSSVQA